MNFPKASVLKKISVKKRAEVVKSKANPAVKEVLTEFKEYIGRVKNGEVKSDCFVMNIPFSGYDDDFKPLLAGVGEVLTPLGYKLEISHDGVGINNTIVIRWA